MEPVDCDKEFQKCENDPAYFMCNYIFVQHPIRGSVIFALYPFQKRIVKEINSHRFNIIRKFRQAGVTTIMCAYALWFIIFQEHKSIMVVSIGDRESTAFLKRVKFMYVNLPAWLKPDIRESNAHMFTLETGSWIKSQPAGAGRSEAVSLLVVDEAAFIDGIREFWNAIFPTISTGGRAVMLSTVNGMSNLYYETYRDAEAGNNDFNVIDIHYKEHPEYNDPKWEATMRSGLGPRGWRQEVLCEFLGTGDTFLDVITLTKLRDNVSEEFYEAYNRRVRIWKEPNSCRDYILSIDPSYGINRDNAAFHIIDTYTGEQVVEFYSCQTKIRELAQIIHKFAIEYNFAQIISERNALGIILIDELLNTLEYDNMWVDEKGEVGIHTNKNTRDTCLEAMQNSLFMNTIKINSKRTVDELVCFITTESGKIEADEGYSDDLVISLALACHAIDKLQQQGLIPAVEPNKPTKEPEFRPLITARYGERKDINLEEYKKWILS